MNRAPLCGAPLIATWREARHAQWLAAAELRRCEKIWLQSLLVGQTFLSALYGRNGDGQECLSHQILIFSHVLRGYRCRSFPVASPNRFVL